MKKGFTLIELLIVVTIIAILAGAAIPYVQEYIEDARISRCKADLNEIKNGLIRYELDKGTTWPTAETTITKLVGPYLAKPIIDPWGQAYIINEPSSVVYSAGPNRVNTITDADNISVQFRPPLALTKAFWIDADKSGTVTSKDQLSLRYTRPLDPANTPVGTDFSVWINGAPTAYGAANFAGTIVANDRTLLVTFSPTALFIPGRDGLVSSGVNIKDTAVAPFGPNLCLSNVVTIQALQ